MYLKAKIFVLAFEGQEFFSFISRENQTPLNQCCTHNVLIQIYLGLYHLVGGKMDPAWSNDFHIYIYITSSKIAVFILIFPIIISPIPFQERVVTVSIFIVRPSVGTNNYIFVIFEV